MVVSMGTVNAMDLAGVVMVGGSALLTPVSTGLYGFGKYCYLKSGAPAYVVNQNPWTALYDGGHDNYPRSFHESSFTKATAKQKQLSHIAYRCLATGSRLSWPVRAVSSVILPIVLISGIMEHEDFGYKKDFSQPIEDALSKLE